uniref:Tether containing UBX domain for GLUT4 n=1 Tax=Phallusia mammillata TaxID=59560 RepID=A0A6F9D6G6_9ASCI|nr:tether containing UBX domain for GLUT4 [Phallusia mammillata]
MPAIVVLCLSKRRKTIKFPINFTVFQILELVCQREQLNPDQYTLRSNNGVLDNTLQWTFTNLPNNAKLELCALSTDSKELKPVDIALQLENGERLQSNFQQTCTLFDVFQHFKSKIKRSCDFENMIPVIVYMRQEIFGEDVFLKTTLSGLGIVSGRALLRLMFKAGNYELAQPQTLPMHPISLQETVNQTDERVSNTQFKALGKSTISDAISTRTQSSSASEEFQETSGSNVCLNYGNEVKEDLNKSSTSLVNSDLQVSKMHDDAKLENPNTNRLSKLSEPCDRQPVLFHSSSIKHPCDVELAEDFFDVTVMDLRKMIADLKRQQ